MVGIPPGNTARRAQRRSPPTFRSMLMPPTCSSSERPATASSRRSIRCRPSSPPRRAHRRQPGQGVARGAEPGRHPAAADLQPGRRLRELCRTRSLRADPAADAADRRRDADRRRAGAGSGGAFASVLGRGIAHLTIYLPALALYFLVLPRVYGFSVLGHPVAIASRWRRCSFSRPASWARRLGAWFKRPETPTLIVLGHQPAAVLPGRLFLAARGDTEAGAGGGLHLPVGFRDRRHRAHRPAGREPVGGGARLARAVGPGHHLFRRSR